jgi:hypothetical protein
MKVILYICVCCFASWTALGRDGASWIAAPPPEFAADEANAIPATDVFEVVASKVHVAIDRRLAPTPIVAVSETAAQYFTGAYYSCPRGKRPFLIRAVYGFGGTGTFRVFKSGRSVWVIHQSLGDGVVAHKSALVINLEFEPEHVYTTVSVVR